MKTRQLLASWALTLSCVAVAIPAGGVSFRSGAFEPARPAPDFALPATTGTEFRLSRAHGKVILLTFGYTNGPTCARPSCRARAGEGPARP